MPDTPVPLSQLAVAGGSVREKGFVKICFEAGNAIELFNFSKDNSLTASAFGIEEAGLPTLSWGAINLRAEDVVTETTARKGWASMVRHTMRADQAHLRAWDQKPRGKSPWTIQSEGFAIAWGRKFGNDLINGAFVSAGVPDPKGFIGWRDMIATNASKAEYYISQTVDIDAGGLNLSPSGITSTAGGEFESRLRQLFWRMGRPTGAGCKIAIGIELMARVEAALRRSVAFKTTEDVFGRTIMKWNDAEFFIVGLAPDGTDILPGFETSTGVIGVSGTNKFSSLFVVNNNDMDNWMGGSMEPKDRPQDNVFDVRLVDALFGFLPTSNRWLGRIFDIQVRD